MGQWEELCIGLTQENSIWFQVQTNLPYTDYSLYTFYSKVSMSTIRLYTIAILYDVICSRFFCIFLCHMIM